MLGRKKLILNGKKQMINLFLGGWTGMFGGRRMFILQF